MIFFKKGWVSKIFKFLLSIGFFIIWEVGLHSYTV